VPESRDPEAAGGLDWFGTLLISLGLAAVTWALIALADAGVGDGAVTGTLVVGLVLIGLFLWQEHRAAAPLVPLRLFRSRVFTGANVLTLLLYFALSGAFFFVPFNLVQVQGYSFTAAGAAFLPATAVMGGLSRWAGGLVERHGARRPLVAGPLTAALGFALFAVPGPELDYWTGFFPAMVVLGVGMAVSVAPLTTVVMGAVDGDRAGLASGVNNAVARVASLIAVALLGVMATGVFGSALEREVAGEELSPAARGVVDVARQDLAGARLPGDLPVAERERITAAIDRAFVNAFRRVVALCALLAAAAGVTAWFTIEGAPDAAGSARRGGGARRSSGSTR
jgi:hypothetical protein